MIGGIKMISVKDIKNGNIELIGNNLIIHSKRTIYVLDDDDKLKFDKIINHVSTQTNQ